MSAPHPMPLMAPEGAAAPAGLPTAIVAAGDEETRVLFRGLLRLHRLKVVGEADGAVPAVELIRAQRPDLVVADSVLAQGTVDELIREGRRVRPGLRVVVVTPAGRPTPPRTAGEGADVVLTRPFRIRQFAEALAPPAIA